MTNQQPQPGQQQTPAAYTCICGQPCDPEDGYCNDCLTYAPELPDTIAGGSFDAWAARQPMIAEDARREYQWYCENGLIGG